MWRILKRIDDDFHPGYPLGVVSLADVLSMLNEMILGFSAFSGVAVENMTRGPGWQFLELGRRIERTLDLIALVRGTLCAPASKEHAVLEAILEIADSAITYRNRYAANLQVAPLLDLLVADESNPRSMTFQLAALASHFESLPRREGTVLSNEQRLVLAILSDLRLAQVHRLAEVDASGLRHNLERLLHQTGQRLSELASSISHTYLVHAGPSRQLAEINLA
jgi:uncharacterized alpha-E superfamily protein